MAECDHPGCDGDDKLPNDCNFCGGQFCVRHRLPEKHYCVPEKPAPDDSPDFRDARSGRDADADDASPTGDVTTSGEAANDDQPTQQRLPSSHDPPSSSAPAVETTNSTDDDDTEGGAAGGTSMSLRDHVPTVSRGSLEETIGTVVLTTLKISIVVLAVLGAVAVFQPGLLEPLGVSGGPFAETTEVANTTTTAVAGATPTPAPTTPAPVEAVSGDTKRERTENWIHAKANRERKANGRDPLRKDDSLRTIARSHSEEMGQQDYFAHESPSGGTYEDRYETYGYYCQVEADNGTLTGGENIWMMETDTAPSAEEIADRAVESWLESPDHRENLLLEYWDDMGIGVYILDTGTQIKIYVTQNFC